MCLYVSGVGVVSCPDPPSGGCGEKRPPEGGSGHETRVGVCVIVCTWMHAQTLQLP